MSHPFARTPQMSANQRPATHTPATHRPAKLARLGLALALLAGGAGFAQAQSFGQGNSPSQPLYGGINLGSPQWRAGVNGVANDDHGTSGKLYLGYQLGPVLSVEGGYLDLGKISDPLGQARARGLFVDAVGTWPIAPQWSVVGRAGLAHGDIKTSTGDDTSLGLRAGLGLQYDLNPSVALRGELERNRFTDVFGQGLSADQVTLGVKMKF